VPPPDPRIHELLGELPAELFGQGFYYSWELVDRYASAWVLQVAADLGLEPSSTPMTSDELAARLGFGAHFQGPLDWLLQRLVVQGAAETVWASNGARRYRLALGSGESRRELRAAALEADPANAAALDLLDAAAVAYPAVAQGRSTGQEALFGLGQIRLWLAYFDNRNPTYAINNKVAALAVANRLQRLEGGVILEVGGGTGSGTEALLEALASVGRLSDLERYRFTEPSQHFRRRTERLLRSRHPEVPWEIGSVDVNLPFAAQGVPERGIDLVFAVNVLHLARDLDDTLRQIRASLSPGGWLVAAEATRSFPDKPLATELVFQLLDGFQQVRLDPDRRPTAGFLAPEQWQRFMVEAGFRRVEILPREHMAIRQLYPRFATGVICGRP
jgi:SAM-dependent methyltransferase